ncbi:MAG: hypothetical protein M3161_07710 [Actinomycetota bacterium]|nr:hypothetical protein [Actinomycetota bacterium]
MNGLGSRGFYFALLVVAVVIIGGLIVINYDRCPNGDFDPASGTCSDAIP